MPVELGQDDAVAARDVLLEVFTEFPFAEGEVVSRFFTPGIHEVILIVGDGQAMGMTQIGFEVITPATALELLIMDVGDSSLPQNRKQPLIASLKVAGASFDRENWTSGTNQLESFRNKVAAQVRKNDPALASRWDRKAAIILEAVEGSSE